MKHRIQQQPFSEDETFHYTDRDGAGSLRAKRAQYQIRATNFEELSVNSDK